MSLLTAVASAEQSGELDRLWKAARDGSYRQPDSIELQQAQQLFERELAADPSAQLQRAWRALGWQRRSIQLAGRTCRALYESTGRREGRGFYLFCPQADSRAALQLPHAFKDLHSGTIALAMAKQAGFPVIAWNTVPRYSDDSQGRHDADLAHRQESYFTALTRALATDRHVEHVIQLHGFSRNKRTGSARQAQLIVSDGTRRPGRAVLELAGRLRETVSPDTRVFPYEVRELGALTNRQGILLREAGNKGFIHIELSAEMRRRLDRDARARRAFADSLPGGPGDRR